MKTILYTLIAIFIFGIIAPCFSNRSNFKNSILIQSTDANISPELLSQSAKIIFNRLQDFSSEKFEVTLVPEKNQIRICLTDNVDLKTVENLLIQKGAIAFYETYNRKSLVEILNGNNQLFSLFPGGTATISDATIGCTSITEVEKVNDYLHTLQLNNKCKFVWNQHFDNSKACLFALKTDKLLDRTNIESVTYEQDKDFKNYEIEIKFEKNSIELWSDATKRNINCAIAILLDGNVLTAPIVNSVITNGKSNISGDYTLSQVKYIAAIGNNGELPVDFLVVK